jgi:hypothetical protein
MSLAEISKFIETKSVGSSEVAKRLEALQTGAVQKEEQSFGTLVSDKEVALALRYVRELHDVVRRFALCDKKAKDVKVDTAEMLAIYRREGAFVITPFASSYRHAPLIGAKTGTCRPDGAPVWDKSTKRGGFVLSHEQASTATPSKNDDVSRSFGLVIRNIVCLAGVDTIIMPRLPAGDELIALLDTAFKRKPKPGPLEHLQKQVEARLSTAPKSKGTVLARQNSITSQFDIFIGLCIGLLMLRIEEVAPDQKLPSVDDLLAKLETDFNALLKAHRPTAPQGGRVFLEADDDGSDGELSMELEASWYASRARVDTLLARRDRTKLGTLPRLSPFLAYMRFHLGDVSFMGAKIRFLVNFQALVAEAKKRKLPWDHPDEFLSLASKVPWSLAETKRATTWQSQWQTVGGEQAWRHVGLIEALGNDGLRAPWLKDAKKALSSTPPKTAAKIEKTAKTALEVIEFYDRKKMFELFDVFMRTTPVAITAEKFPIVKLSDAAHQRQAVAKTHNFEQLRIVYADAIKRAGN